MEENEQLTFTDDPVLSAAGQAYLLIEAGDFDNAVAVFDQLIEKSPDYPGLQAGYRTARFWQNRTDTISSLRDGKEKADFLMNQWNDFHNYATDKNFSDSSAYKAAQKNIYFNASEHYMTAFKNQESPTNNFDLLMNMGLCFITLGEYRRTIESLEYARSTHKSNPKLLSLLAEAYYHTGEIPKSLAMFREAFFINPADIDLTRLTSEPILKISELIRELHLDGDIREWIPIIGHIQDFFYVKGQISRQTVDLIRKDIMMLESNYSMMTTDRIKGTNVIPRLINKYLWLFDYYQYQQYNPENLSEIRARLIQIDKDLFQVYFSKIKI